MYYIHTQVNLIPINSILQESYCNLHFEKLTDQRVSIPLQWPLSALLVQESVYICNMGFKDEQRKKELLVFAEAVDNEDADVGECQEYNFELKIDDQLPLSDFPWWAVKKSSKISHLNFKDGLHLEYCKCNQSVKLQFNHF